MPKKQWKNLGTKSFSYNQEEKVFAELMTEKKTKRESLIKVICGFIVVLIGWAIGFLALRGQLLSSLGGSSGIVFWNLILFAIGYHLVGRLIEKLLCHNKNEGERR